MGYGKTQKSAFTGLFLGFLMCAIAMWAPWWIHAEGRSRPVTIDIGPWLYCKEYPEGKYCELYDAEELDSSKIWISRIASIALVLECLVCDFVGMCQGSCSTDGKTVKHGVAAFFAGCAGIVTNAVFVRCIEDQFSFRNIETSYGWSFRLYIAGTVFIFIAAFLLGFSDPDNSVPRVVHATMAENTVVVANVTQQMQSFATPQYPYPNPMFAGPSTAMYPGQHQPMDLQQPPNHPLSTQPHMNSEDMSKHHGWV